MFRNQVSRDTGNSAWYSKDYQQIDTHTLKLPRRKITNWWNKIRALIRGTAKNTTIASTAIIGKNVYIGSDVYIGDHVRICKNAMIQDGATILESSLIYSGTIIETNAVVHQRCTIGLSAQVGSGAELHECVMMVGHTHLKIAPKCKIGAYSVIQHNITQRGRTIDPGSVVVYDKERNEEHVHKPNALRVCVDALKTYVPQHHRLTVDDMLVLLDAQHTNDHRTIYTCSQCHKSTVVRASVTDDDTTAIQHHFVWECTALEKTPETVFACATKRTKNRK